MKLAVETVVSLAIWSIALIAPPHVVHPSQNYVESDGIVSAAIVALADDSSRPERGHIAALLAKAQTHGAVCVSVGLPIGFQPEGKLFTPQDAHRQRDAIVHA
jgi:hypothetical protein